MVLWRFLVPQVPLIDLHRPETEILSLLVAACTTSGFFVLKNHSIPSALRQTVLQNCQTFFGLPKDEKLKYKSEVMYTVRSTEKIYLSALLHALCAMP